MVPPSDHARSRRLSLDSPGSIGSDSRPGRGPDPSPDRDSPLPRSCVPSAVATRGDSARLVAR